LLFLSPGEELAGGLDFKLTHGNRVMSESEKPNTTLENTTYNFGSRHTRAVILSDNIRLDTVLDNSVEPQNGNLAISELIHEENKEARDIEEAGLDDVAYLIYTSGLPFFAVSP
jgi:long-subunit acyl-CoA synthetase (AMP-forming)